RLQAGTLALGWPEKLRISHDEQADALVAGAAESGGPATGITRVWLCASASEAAALAGSLRRRGAPLPPGIALAAALTTADLKSPARPAEPLAPSIARIRIK
ncbi:MAG TPA: hypothetical protein VMV01_06275, partial [Planctomycetota bacterium]|nr:hypothetical protein [Planctomycetota bacterium]